MTRGKAKIIRTKHYIFQAIDLIGNGMEHFGWGWGILQESAFASPYQRA